MGAVSHRTAGESLARSRTRQRQRRNDADAQSRLHSAGVRALLVVLVVLCLPGVALAAPGLLDGSDAPERPASHAGWLVAQASSPSPEVSDELMAIDQRIAQVLRERPTDGRVTTGAVLTVGGGLVLAAGTGVFLAFLSAGGWAVFMAVFVGLPMLVLGVFVLIPGLVLWVTGLSGRREADKELTRLRARRAELLSPPEAPEPNVPPETIPQVWRGAPPPAFTLARF